MVELFTWRNNYNVTRTNVMSNIFNVPDPIPFQNVENKIALGVVKLFKMTMYGFLINYRCLGALITDIVDSHCHTMFFKYRCVFLFKNDLIHI